MSNSVEQATHTKRRTAVAQTSAMRWLAVTSERSIRLFVLLVLVLITGMSVVNATFKNRFALHELQQLRSQQNELDVQWGQLLIEQSTFGLEGRIERRAMEELDMKLPDWSGVIMVKYE